MSYRTTCDACDRSHTAAARYCPWCGRYARDRTDRPRLRGWVTLADRLDEARGRS